IIFLVCLLVPGVAAAQSGDGPLVIPASETYAGNLATATRAIRVEGAVTGDVTSWSGDIVIAGRVGGDVVSYSGQVTIQSGGQVRGHVMALGGALRPDAGAVVVGQTIRGGEGSVALANLLDLFAPTGASSDDVAVGRVLFGMALGVFLLAFCLLCIAFWPRRTTATSLTLRRSPRQALLLGLLSTLLLALALPPLIALLAATLIGMPLIVVLLALAQAPYVLGLATLVRAVGPVPNRPAAGPERTTLLAGVALALLVGISAALAPLWGLALFYLLASPGLGAALLSRGGLFAPAANST
ncbi:MAG: polymer-forming cytoskeletal protein, partial [Roseiflexaceae bacterium]